MTEREIFADKIHGHATNDDSPHTNRAPKRRWTDVRKHCLPALVVTQKPIPRPDSARVVCEEKMMNRKMLFLARAAVYLLAFLVPPVLVSVVGTSPTSRPTA